MHPPGEDYRRTILEMPIASVRERGRVDKQGGPLPTSRALIEENGHIMSPLDLLTLLCAVGSGLVAGVFLAFSICIMKALGALPPAHGIAAMQSINVVIINPWFLSVFLGTGGACVFATVASVIWWDSAAPWALVGSVLYLVGVVFVTMRFNVPRNNALARVAPESAEAAELWAGYLSRWTAWNHVRTSAALAAALAFAIPRWPGP
jgi:uncharacterized membrane protein